MKKAGRTIQRPGGVAVRVARHRTEQKAAMLREVSKRRAALAPEDEELVVAFVDFDARGEREIEPTEVLAVSDYLHLRQRAMAGDVVTELPPFLAAEALRDGRLVALLPDHPFPKQEVRLLYQRQLHPSRVVRAYLDDCRRVVGRYLASA